MGLDDSLRLHVAPKFPTKRQHLIGYRHGAIYGTIKRLARSETVLPQQASD